MNNFKVRGNSFYTTVDGPGWTEAEANANKLGGNLVTINNAEENIFVFKNFGIDPSTDKTISSGYWIGLTDQQSEGDWKWISGEENKWMSAGFQPGVYGYEPNGNGDHVWVKAGFGRTKESYDEFVA